jgi:hypothetical protein
MSDNVLTQQITEATEIFEKDEGEWEVEMEIRPAPGVPPVRINGTSVNRRIGGGRWLVIDHTADRGFAAHSLSAMPGSCV